VWIEKLPLKKPYTIAYKTIADTEIIFLEVTLENGITGIGASSPSFEVVGETPQNTLANLQSGYLDQLVGRDIRHINQLIDEATSSFHKLPGTLAAIDIALHDAFCKHLSIPVLDFYGRKMDALPTSVTIGIKDAREMMEEAEGYYALGFRILKIKTGLDVDADIERVHALSEKFKNKFVLRVDANQGYSLQQLRKFIQGTKDLSLELIEQPLKAGNDDELLQLSDAERKLLAADESLLNTSLAIQLSHVPMPYGIFNIKLMKCGGIKAAKEIGMIAAHAGASLFWGCNDESIVSITAALHVAYSCANTKYLDLDGSFDLSKDLVEGGFTLKDGYMHPNNLPGFGVQRIE
jgi:L-alanine-DL-glutamate epimerase-like enolase superfamily enzyme